MDKMKMFQIIHIYHVIYIEYGFIFSTEETMTFRCGLLFVIVGSGI